MNSAVASPSPDSAGNCTFSPTQRTVASFLLFVHLFSLFIAVAARPRDQMTSGLWNKLANFRLLAVPRQVLWMDLGYDYFHSYGNNEFVTSMSCDHDLLAELKFPSGETRTYRLIDDKKFPRVRLQRFIDLANSAVLFLGQQGIESIVPQMVCQNLAQTTGASQVTVRLRRHLLQTPDQARSLDQTIRDRSNARYFQTVYTGVGRVVEGEFIYQKIESARDSAPATRTQGNANRPGTQGPALPTGDTLPGTGLPNGNLPGNNLPGTILPNGSLPNSGLPGALPQK